ncbi:hypothetical protein ACQPUI_20600 [Clostridium butyricum]|uniref:Uncharacterized protein n=1 Tax=Clostridium butyricum TaxID=1492 RepID=A0A6N3GW98_CLOBU|nr:MULTISPECIES: hypothetical protein [Clostridium]POO86610.1 hypothetical protein C1H59_09895 [Clostridium sp. 3-3]QUF82854.1 hypothetical protein KDJ93_14130 [Clostridium butyricum]UZT05816.1 hypothetical protein ONV75_14620 [Clostridium sp. LQ25]
MTMNNTNFSSIIQSFMMNEINSIINKYSNIEAKKLEYVEALISKVDGKFKEELLQDFDKALKLATEIGENDVDNLKINVFLWIKNNSNLELNISEVIKYIEAVEEEGYVSVDEGIIIYKKGTDLTHFAREKLETMLEEERFVDKLLDKDSLIEYWMNGTSKDQVIRELVNGIEAEELLDFDSKFIAENQHGEEYIYAEIDC